MKDVNNDVKINQFFSNEVTIVPQVFEDYCLRFYLKVKFKITLKGYRLTIIYTL